MNSFQRANMYIFDLLYEQCIFEIDFDNIPIEGWLYQSRFPLMIPEQNALGSYHFFLYLYQWNSSEQCLKRIKLKYQGIPITQIIYKNNPEIDESVNQLGKNFIKNEKFLIHVKPLLLEGFRDIAFRELMDSD